MVNAAFQSGIRLQAGKRPMARRAGWMRWTAIACVLLVAFAATLQVAHSHSTDKSAEHCQICFAIHSAMPAQAVATHVVLTRTHQPSAELIHAVRPRFWISPFANGPPTLRSA